MNKPEKNNQADMDMLFEKARKVFSTGMVNMIESQGLCIIEGKREGSMIYGTDGKSYIDCYTSEGTYNLGRKNPSTGGSVQMGRKF